MKKYAVIGKPVSHSLSPVIHQQFASQFDLELDYMKILAQASEFNEKVSTFRADGGSGLNVTLPYKHEAYSMADELSGTAIKARSVNTLSFKGDLVTGDNTDGTGLVNDLNTNLQFDLKNKRILVLGAGGAVSGVISPLLAKKPASIVVANRTVSKAMALVTQFENDGPIQGCGLEQAGDAGYDLVINGTAASLSGQVPDVNPAVLDGARLAYDMMYAKQPTAFMNWAARHGALRTADGLGMLVEQAAASFFIWHELKPDTTNVLKLLRNNG